MNSQKLSPLSIFVGIADAVKVNFEGFKMLLSQRRGGHKGLTFFYSAIVCLFHKKGEKDDEKKICF